MFMMLYAGHFITDSTCHNLITNSSLFVKVPCLGQWPVHILTQILIWSYSFAVLSRIRGEKNHTHVHTQAHACTPHTHACMHTTHTLSLSLSLLSNILTVSIPPVPYSLPDHSVQVLVLQMTCQTCFGSKLAASLSAATYLSSRFSCAKFWSAFVAKDCKQLQSSFELMWKE